MGVYSRPVPCEERKRFEQVYLDAVRKNVMSGARILNTKSEAWREATKETRAACEQECRRLLNRSRQFRAECVRLVQSASGTTQAGLAQGPAVCFLRSRHSPPEDNPPSQSMSWISYPVGRFSGVHGWPVLGVPRGSFEKNTLSPRKSRQGNDFTARLADRLYFVLVEASAACRTIMR
jgi:hypothetical protein